MRQPFNLAALSILALAIACSEHKPPPSDYVERPFGAGWGNSRNSATQSSSAPASGDAFAKVGAKAADVPPICRALDLPEADARRPAIDGISVVGSGDIPGVTAPELSAAPRGLALAALGAPCPNRPEVWPGTFAGEEYAMFDPRIIDLPDGARVLLVAGSPGSQHGAWGIIAAARISDDGQHVGPLMELAGGGSWGTAGSIGVPVEQAAGMFQLWVSGGGTFQGFTSVGLGLNDLASTPPRRLGHIHEGADAPCEYGKSQDGPTCPNAYQTELTDWSFVAGPKHILVAEWRHVRFDVDRATEAKKNVRRRTYRAEYELIDSGYKLASGEEPPTP